MLSEPLLTTPGDQGVLTAGTHLLSVLVDAPPLPLVVDSAVWPLLLWNPIISTEIGEPTSAAASPPPCMPSRRTIPKPSKHVSAPLTKGFLGALVKGTSSGSSGNP